MPQIKRASAAPWVAELEAVLGWHEVRDRERLARWLRSDGRTLGDPSALPWCGDAVDTALSLALPAEPRPGPLAQNRYWALNWGSLGVKTAPVYGAIATFVRPGGGHVGFLVGEDAEAYCVLGGNQSNAVTRAWIDKKRARDFRWPATCPNPGLALPRLKRGSEALSSNEA